MKKYKIEVTRKNGNKCEVAVYLDDTTASLLESVGDEKLLRTYLLEEYKSSRRDRQEEFWNQSLDEDFENGIDYEYKPTNGDFSFDDMNDEKLQAVIAQLKPRQREMLRLKYVEGRTQKEIAEIFGLNKRTVSDAIHRIYDVIQKNYEKK